VLLSLGVLLEDFALVVLALIVGGAGILVEIVVGKAAVRGTSGTSSRSRDRVRRPWSAGT
jgi:hypothetical protein